MWSTLPLLDYVIRPFPLPARLPRPPRSTYYVNFYPIYVLLFYKFNKTYIYILFYLY